MPIPAARRAVFLSAFAIVACATACSREPAPAASSAPAAQKALTRVTVNFRPIVTYGPLMIAKEEGYFEKEGIDAEFVTLDSNSALTALNLGKIDVQPTGLRASVFNLIQRGEPIQYVVGKGHDNPACSAEALVAPSAMAKRIAAKDGSVRGERIAVIRGNAGEFLTSKLLARHNLTYADVEVIPMPEGTPVSSRDKIDAVRFVGEPNLTILLGEGGAEVVAWGNELAPRHQSTGILYGKRLLHDDPELGKRFMRAYLRGVRQWNEGATDRNVEIVCRQTKLPQEIVRRMCWPVHGNDGRIDPADVQEQLDWMLRMKYLDGPVTATWWNPSFIDDAVRTLDSGAH